MDVCGVIVQGSGEDGIGYKDVWPETGNLDSCIGSRS